MNERVTLTDDERGELTRLFGWVPEPEPLEQMLAAVERIVASHVGRALHDAADFIDEDMATAWGGDASWLTTGTRVAELVADILRERADEIGGAS